MCSHLGLAEFKVSQSSQWPLGAAMTTDISIASHTSPEAQSVQVWAMRVDRRAGCESRCLIAVGAGHWLVDSDNRSIRPVG